MNKYYRKKRKSSIKIIPLGGVGEIGKNMTALEYKNQIFIVDAGLTFPDETMPGIDIVIPDFTYLEQNKHKIKGLFVTHGHEDHIGAVPYLLKKINMRVYATPLTLGLIEAKLEEHGLNKSVLKTVKQGQTIRISDVDVEFIAVTHSIPDSCALAFHTDIGIVFFTGDFKVDFTPIDGVKMDLQRLGELGKQGVLCMFGESTNIERPGSTLSELTIRETFKKVFADSKGRILVATFASNLHRVQQVLDATEFNNKKLFVSGRSMLRNVKIAIELGYLKVKKDTIQDMNKINKFKPEEIVVLTTGSQGEQMAALTRMAREEHSKLKLTEKDTVVISATPIPGNDAAMGSVINNLTKLGVNVVYSKLADVHVSGHASREELKLMLALIQPKYFIPAHGEIRHQVMHKSLAISMGVKEENVFITEVGDVVEIGLHGAQMKEKVPAGKVLVDGLGIGDVGNVVLRDRIKLAEDGIINVAMSFDKNTGNIIGKPQMNTRGFVYVKDSKNLMEGTYKILENAKNEINAKRISDTNQMKYLINEKLRVFFYTELKRNPMIMTMILEI